MTSKISTKKESQCMLDQFLGELITMYIINASTVVRTPEGDAEMPLIVEGILTDYDEHYIMIANDVKTVFSLVSRSQIAKIDIGDKLDVLLDSVMPRNPQDFN